MPMEINLPGQALEKAAGDVGTYASKKLIDFLQVYGGSFLIPGIAKREAQGRQIAARIDQLSENERQDLEAAARRRRELEEKDHELILDLRARAAARFMQEIEQEQLSIDTIVNNAVTKVKHLGENAEPRDIEPDWIRAFLKYAKDVTNDKIRDIFADILAEASISEGQLIPPKILDMIRFMDKASVGEFEKFAKYISIYGFVTEAFVNTLTGRGVFKPQALEMLEELGLIKRSYIYMAQSQIGQFLFNISLDVGSTYRFDIYKLSQAGSTLIDIVNEDIRAVRDARGKPGSTDRLWAAQRRLGISAAEFRSFSRHVVSEVSDANHVQVQIYARFDERTFRPLADVEKRNTFDPFRLELSSADIEKYDIDNAEFVRVFVDVFRDYDENTLPSMTRNDDRNDGAKAAS